MTSFPSASTIVANMMGASSRCSSARIKSCTDWRPALVTLAGIGIFVVRQGFRLLDRMRTDAGIASTSVVEADVQLSSAAGASCLAPRFVTRQEALKWIQWQQSRFVSILSAVAVGLGASSLLVFLTVIDAYIDRPQPLAGAWWVGGAIRLSCGSLFFSSLVGVFIAALAGVGVQRPGNPKANLMSTFLSSKL